MLVAAGRGTRSGLAENKAFYPIRGRAMVLRSLDALAGSGEFEGGVLVVSGEDEAKMRGLLSREAWPVPVRVALGGKTRQASVRAGIEQVDIDADVIAVHDAARPFVNREIIQTVLAGARETGSGVIATAVTDTIKQVEEDGRVVTLPRARLRAVQTPQAFRAAQLRRAHAQALQEGFEATDDAMLYERYYGTVTLVSAPGAEANRKMTTPEDFRAQEMPALRVGTGYDAHRLVEGRPLILCGVQVPHDRGLDGHSDADVAVHALMDALLGAAGEGDIGLQFPDSDEAYRGISSMVLLSRVMELLKGKGWRVVNADLTIVAQRPKLRPCIDAMIENLRGALDTDAVSVKATTTERMGFEGREEGISAQASALICRQTP